MGRAGIPARAGLAALLRPRLWPAMAKMVPPGWWRRWPPVPLPPAEYIRFRNETMFGDHGGPLDPAELVAYLEWCRRVETRAR